MKKRNRLIFLLILFFPTIYLYAHGGHPGSGETLIRFTENKRQWEDHIRFQAFIPGGTLFLHNNSLTYFFREMPAHHGLGNPADTVFKAHAFRVDFPGANQEPSLRGFGKAEETVNYILGNDPSRWASGVCSYSGVEYLNLFPGTDMKLFEKDGSLKYEFTLAAGANAALIKMKYTGADSIKIVNGDLLVYTTMGIIRENKPYAYQLIKGKEMAVPCNFALEDTVLSFAFPKGHNRNYPLIIDPQLIFSTYSGSLADNWGNTATYDEEGNLYSGGIAFGSGFPVSIGAYQTTFRGNVDVAIIKFDSTGTKRVYATYLGGSGTEVPQSIVVNENNELVILGITGSTNFPVTAGAFRTTFQGGSGNITPVEGITFSGGSDLYIARLNKDGTALLASTYVGGSSDDGMLRETDALTKNYGDQFRGDIITDKDNNVYVASNTRSTNFPVTGSSFRTTFSGGTYDAVVFKMNPNLTSMIWSGYLGGSGMDAAFSIQLDKENNVYVGGGTTSSNFPVTAGVIKNFYSGNIDGFVTRISANGNSILNSTFIGTTSYDQVYFVQLDTTEQVYLFGQTQGVYPVVNAAYSNPNSGQFIHKLNKTLSSTFFSTVIGSGDRSPNISPTSFLVNECENIFLAGWGGVVNKAPYIGGYTTNLPLTEDKFPHTPDDSDFYIMVLEKNAASLLFGTYFGENFRHEFIGDHVDGGTSRFDKRGIIYQAACASCTGTQGFTTYPNPGAWSNTNQSTQPNCNNAAFKFDLASLIANFDPSISQGCAPQTITFINKSLGGRSYDWYMGNGHTFTTTNYAPFTHSYTEAGTYEIMLVATDFTTCIGKDTAYRTIEIFDVDFEVNAGDTICQGDLVQLNASPFESSYTYNWTPAWGLSNPFIHNPQAQPDSSVIYYVTVTDTNQCSRTKSVQIEVIGSIYADFENLTECTGPPVIQFVNHSKGPVTYKWDFGDGNSSFEKEPLHTYADFGKYTVVLTFDSDVCYDSDTLYLDLEKVLIPNLITPNNDGHNEKYRIKGISNGWTLEIYNRWGKRIYLNEDYDHTWGGEGLSEGVYYYLVTSPRGKSCKGWVHILR